MYNISYEFAKKSKDPYLPTLDLTPALHFRHSNHQYTTLLCKYLRLDSI